MRRGGNLCGGSWGVFCYRRYGVFLWSLRGGSYSLVWAYISVRCAWQASGLWCNVAYLYDDRVGGFSYGNGRRYDGGGLEQCDCNGSY